MAKGTSVDELFVSLGLDLSSLDRDFIEAEKSVKDNIARLRSQKNNVKLQMDIDMKKLPETATQVEKLHIQESALNKQLKIQESIVALVNAEYQKSVQAKGASASASLRLQGQLLKEQNLMADIVKAQQLNSATNSDDSKSILARVGDAVKAMAGGDLTSVIAGLAGVATGAKVATMAIDALGKGFSFLKSTAMEALSSGEKLYQIGERMHMTMLESDALSDTLTTAGVDYDTFSKTFVRLNKQVLSGNKETTDALNKFGVSLTDASGKLLPMNQQLDELAKGYQRASEYGQEEAYLVQTLGARGQALVPLLRELGTIREKNAKIIDPNLNIELIHDVAMESKVLETQLDNVKGAIGNAFMPLISEILPIVTEGLALLTSTIKSMTGETNSLAVSLREINNQGAWGFVDNGIKLITSFNPLLESMADKLREVSGINAFEEQAKAEMRAEDMARKAEKAQRDAKAKNAKSLVDNSAVIAKAREEEKKQAEETAKATASLEEEVFKASHTAIENQIHDIQKKADAYRSQGVDEVKVAQYVEAQKAKLAQDFSQNTLSKINEIYKTQLQIRLESIDKEKEAWRQKGIDEVSATKWAEEQKQDAIRSVAERTLKEDRERFDAYRKAVEADRKAVENPIAGSYIDKNGNKVDVQRRGGNVANLAKEQIAIERQKLGIKDGETFNSQDFVEFQSFLKELKKSIIPFADAGIGGTTASKGNIQNVNAPITINIDSPMVQNEASISDLADKVADKIEPSIIQALGGRSNGY